MRIGGRRKTKKKKKQDGETVKIAFARRGGGNGFVEYREAE